MRPFHAGVSRPINDVTVIGGGVIGCSVAYWLARRGLGVTVLEAGEVGGGTSGACDGFISLQSKEPGPMMNMARSSLELFHRLSGQLAGDIEFEPCGGMLLANNARDLTVLAHLAEDAAAHGLDVQVVGPGEAREMEPALDAHLAGATLCAAEAEVNPLNLTLALARAAVENGAHIFEGCRVESISRSGTCWHLVTACATWQSEEVVCCAGAWSTEICRSMGLHIPIQPLKGQIMVTESAAPLIRHTLAGAEYIAAKHPGVAAAYARTGFTAEQTRSGNILLGSTREQASFDRSTTPETMRAIAELSRRYLPAASGLNVIRTFSGLRPQSTDGMPLLGESPGMPGFYLGTGHGGDGIALSLESGRLLARSIAEGREPEELRPFSPSRFLN